MHGIVHAEFRDYATARLGMEGWAELLESAGSPGKLHLLSETYPDEELTALVAAMAERTGRPAGAVLEEFGSAIVPGLLRTYGTFVEPTWRTLEVVEHTEQVIHRTVRLQSPGTDPPRLRAERPDRDEVRVLYASPRRLCEFGRGIVAGVAAHFGERVSTDEPLCMHRGDPHCELVVRLERR
jgi:predicted hydrocarbon binding protein